MSRHKFACKGDLAMRPESVGLTWPRAPGTNEWDRSTCRDGVAVVQIHGPLEHRGGWWFDSYEKILSRVEGALECEDVRAVILDIDSPGGEVSGLQETVRKIRALRVEHDKPIVAYANDEAYSAAYALACAADEIYMPEGGGVGSVGVLAELQNLMGAADKAGITIEVIRSGSRKAEGHPFLPITDATRSHVQARVDDLAEQFFALVADVRPMTTEKLASLQGAVVYGKRAVKMGLADAIASFDEVLSFFGPGSRIDTDPGNGIDHTHAADPGVADMTIAAKVSAVLVALRSANTSSKKKAAIAAYDALLASVGTKAVALKKDPTAKKMAAAYASALASLTEAKVKRMYKKKEETIEEDDGEEEGDDDEEPDDDDDDDEEAEEDDTEKATKSKKAAASLAAFVKSLTGQSSAKAQCEVLASMHETAVLAQQANERIAALEAAAIESDRKAVITSMVAAGQLKPAQVAWAETQSIKSLKSYAKATPAMFAPRPAPMQNGAPDSDGGGESRDVDGLTAFERKLCAEQNIKPESYKAQRDGGALPMPKVN